MPNKYVPPSPINIFALGKLNNKKESKKINWPVKKKEKSLFSFSKLINNKIELIKIKFIAKSPLNPSIKFAPLIINKTHKEIK